MSHDPGAFLGLEGAECGAGALGVVVPVPYEATTTYKRGTARGPAAILEASQQVEFYDEWLEDEARRYGVRTLPPVAVDGPPEQLAEQLEPQVGEILDAGRMPLVLGGEHSLSLGPIRAAARRHKTLTILHLDAHPDLRDEYHGTRYGHGCIMRRVLDLPNTHIHAFGIRAISPEERDLYRTQRRATAVLAKELLPLHPLERVERVLRDLPHGPLWLSFDVDGLDPSIVMSTGTPEPGGVDWYTVSELLVQLDRMRRPIVGVEVLELLPHASLHASEFAAARLSHRMLLLGLRSLARATAGTSVA
ncbi:MAG: agmatinase [Planctomycetota bacterium]|nr:MAG: agmatinase [Planctomycetota bacterium]